jgi:hypothetical protein
MVNSHCGNLWAITSYFNPIGYRRRLKNYRIFRQRLNVPLVAVELSLNENFQLGPGDADILVQLRGTGVLWQKERLLNIALKSVPKTCGKIAWLDCDVIFESDDWSERASLALDQFALLHLFHERHNLPPDVTPDQLGVENGSQPAMSVVCKMLVGESTPEDLFEADAPLKRRSTAGLAWGSRREVLDSHGIYDACILGSADRAILCAALGRFDYAARALLMDNQRVEHFLGWAKPYYDTVGGRVGYIQGRLYHLWHGELQNRQYSLRQRALKKYGFDPFTDIALDRNGCWRWNSDKRELHQFVRDYFESRKEDGDEDKESQVG